MAAARKAAVMLGHFRKATREPNEWVKYMMSPEATVWYIVLSGFSGDEDEYAGGEYLVRVEAVEDFPYKPPWFYFMTPNGLYGHSTPDNPKKVCINIGGYHADNYRATLGMSGFVEQLVSGMIGWKSLGGGVNIVTTTTEEKRQIAAESREFNRREYGSIMAEIDAVYAEYSAKWQRAPAPASTSASTSASAPNSAPNSALDPAPTTPVAPN